MPVNVFSPHIYATYIWRFNLLNTRWRKGQVPLRIFPYLWKKLKIKIVRLEIVRRKNRKGQRKKMNADDRQVNVEWSMYSNAVSVLRHKNAKLIVIYEKQTEVFSWFSFGIRLAKRNFLSSGDMSICT